MIKYILLLIVNFFIKFSKKFRNICFRAGDTKRITKICFLFILYPFLALNFIVVGNIYSQTFNNSYISVDIDRPVSVKIIDGFKRLLNVRKGPGKRFSVMTKVKVGHKFVAYEKAIKENETWYRVYLPNAKGIASGWVAGANEDCTSNTCSEEDPNSSVVVINAKFKIRTDAGTARGKEIKVNNKYWDNKNKIYKIQAINVYLWKDQQFVASEKKYESGDADDPGNRCNTGLWYKIYLPDSENKYFYEVNPNATGCPNATDCPELETSMGWICGDAVDDTLEFSVSLSSDPTHGISPLSVNFIANVDGSASEYYNYYFWWNCDYPGYDIASARAACGNPEESSIGSVFKKVNSIQKIVTHTYLDAFQYTAKIIVEADGVLTGSRTNVNVGASTVNVITEPSYGGVEHVLGLGYGLPYGAKLGINYELGLTRHLAPTIGVGYSDKNLRWNVGARLYYPFRNNTIRVRTTALYGTNAVLKDGPRNNETIENISIGLGVNWRREKGPNFDVDIFYSFYNDIPGYNNDIYNIKIAIGSSYNW